MIIDPDSTPIKQIDASKEPLIPSLKRRTEKKHYGVPELAALNVEIRDYKEAWREMFKDKTLDVILGPGAQHTAVEHDKHQLPAYSCMWNLLDVSISTHSLWISFDLQTIVSGLSYSIQHGFKGPRPRFPHHHLAS